MILRSVSHDKDYRAWVRRVVSELELERLSRTHGVESDEAPIL
jgi:hypothetical protein